MNLISGQIDPFEFYSLVGGEIPPQRPLLEFHELDFGSVKEKLHNKKYEKIIEWISDIRFILERVIQYSEGII